MRIVILNDGTTWTNIEGCMVAEVPDDFDGDANDMEIMTYMHPVYSGEVGTDNEDQIILYTGEYLAGKGEEKND